MKARDSCILGNIIYIYHAVQIACCQKVAVRVEGHGRYLVEVEARPDLGPHEGKAGGEACR